MSFFINKMSQNVWATIMPFGPVTLIFYWPSFQALLSVLIRNNVKLIKNRKEKRVF